MKQCLLLVAIFILNSSCSATRSGSVWTDRLDGLREKGEHRSLSHSEVADALGMEKLPTSPNILGSGEFVSLGSRCILFLDSPSRFIEAEPTNLALPQAQACSQRIDAVSLLHRGRVVWRLESPSWANRMKQQRGRFSIPLK